MEAAKILRANELLSTLHTTGWTNAQFWEANQILSSVPSNDYPEELVNLLFAWGDIESDRIACGEHDGCDEQLDAELQAKWPIR